MGTDSKVTKQIDTNDLPAFFRALADAIENGGSEEFAGVEDFKKFKISGKSDLGQIFIKAKFKSAKECCEAPNVVEDAEDGEAIAGQPKYKALKKRMQSSFKTIFKLIHENQLPPQDVVNSFLADSKLMVGYPGYGDEYYTEFTKICDAFAAAYASGDMDKVGETIDAIAHEKSRCHAKYD